MSYMVALTFPFRECSFVVSVMCREQGMTGLRDTVVAAALEVVPLGPGWTCGDGQPWFRDPYDPNWVGGPRRNRSDDASYDAQFPDHPLSRARAYLELLRRVELPPEARALAPFV